VQRTQFPTVPNTEQELYLTAIQRIFTELNQSGDGVVFRDFRQWLRDNALWNREESEKLLDFLGCETRPNVVVGDFGRRFLEASTPESQQALFYEWLCGWNPILHKIVFDALDSETNGHMHSEHELYRVITSYVYPGEYVTLPEFQHWIQWMSVTGCIRYVGIRWGLSETGLNAMATVRQLDIEDLLEDEEYEKKEQGSDVTESKPQLRSNPASPDDKPKASTDASQVVAPAAEETPPDEHKAGASTPDSSSEKGDNKQSVGSAAASPTKPNGSGQAAGGDDEEEMADMPPEAPIPEWTNEGSQSEEQPDQSGELVPARAWFRDLCGSGRPSAIALGLDPAGYEANRSLFVFQMMALGRIVSDSDGDQQTSALLSFLHKVKFLERYFTEKESLESMLGDIRFFRERLDLRQTFRRYAFDLMRYKMALVNHSGFCDRLEQAENVRALLQILKDELYETDSSVAPLWVASEMWAMSLWNNFSA
jgi:hypothetical protein